MYMFIYTFNITVMVMVLQKHFAENNLLYYIVSHFICMSLNKNQFFFKLFRIKLH